MVREWCIGGVAWCCVGVSVSVWGEGEEGPVGRFSARGLGASPTLKLQALPEIEVRDTLWQISDIACVPVFIS